MAPRMKPSAARGHFSDRSKVLISTNVLHTGIAYHLGGEYPVSVSCLGRHEAVGGKEDGGCQDRKFLLLILPGSAEIALQMGYFFSSGYA